ncbi:hypothetical protein QTH91_05005 [Variovorax dokdonensis]|uniref:DUF3311 domain-containing protein n=1 Tax=Variovorax dokdonensis TaxID=344883 RepID=A0ABT7N7H6_9BURK|nr:hypothetical protein [Variovorax dokdonensis]MDM0043835.1 hypothetical protein [Variovorax dokdonensis]
MERRTPSPRARNLAALLPVVGLLLLTPPLVTLFTGRMLFGIPLIVLYLFGIWGVLVLAAGVLSTRLRDSPPPEGAQQPQGEPPVDSAPPVARRP